MNELLRAAAKKREGGQPPPTPGPTYYPPEDTYWSSVESLMSFEGDLTDSANPAVPWWQKLTPGHTHTFPAGNISNCIRMQGQYSGIHREAATEYSVYNDDFTLEFWMKDDTPANAPGNHHAVWGPATTSGYSPFGVYAIVATGTPYLQFFSSSDGVSWDLSTFNIITPINVWTHYAICRAGSKFLVFVDGNLVTSFIYAGQFSYGVEQNERIGPWGESWQSTTDLYIDEFRLTRGVARYLQNFNPPKRQFNTTGPSYDPYYDNVTYLNNFTGLNASVWEDQTHAHTLIGNATIQDGVLTPGTGGLYVANLDTQLASSDFFIEAWFKKTTDVEQTIISDARVSGNPKWRLYITVDGTVKFFYNDQIWGPSNSISSNYWFHVAVMLRNGNFYLWINGYLQAAQGSFTQFTNPGTGILIGMGGTIGNYNTPFSGQIASVRLTKGSDRYLYAYKIKSPGTGLGTNLPYKAPTVNLRSDPYWNNVSLKYDFDDANVNYSSWVYDKTGWRWTAYNTPAVGASGFNITNSRSLALNGTNQYLTCPAGDRIFNISGRGLTIEAWVKVENVTNHNVILTNHFPGNAIGFHFAIYQQKIFTTWKQGAVSAYSDNLVPNNTWVHVAVCRDTDISPIRMYINGIQSSVSYATGVATDYHEYTGGVPCIGRNGGVGGTDGYFGGLIDELRVTLGFARYIKNFTPNRRLPAPSDSYYDPYWDNVVCLSHFSGDTAVDYSNLEKSLGIVGTINSFTYNALSGITSLNFGSNDCGLLVENGGQDFAFGTGDFTIEFQFSTTNGAATQTLYDSRPGGSDLGIPEDNNQRYPVLTLYQGVIQYYTKSVFRIVGTTPIQSNVKYHVALSRKSGVTRLFLNGKQEANSFTDSIDYINGASYLPWLGGSSNTPSGYSLVGTLDEFRVTKGIGRYDSDFNVPITPFPSKPEVLSPKSFYTYAEWNPIDTPATYTLSNNNLTLLKTESTNNSVRSTIPKRTGKWYVELVNSTATADGQLGLASVLNATVIYTYLGAPASDSVLMHVTGGIQSYADSPFAVDGGTVYDLNISTGGTIMFAIDLDNQKAWVGKNGVWQGDPVAKTNPAITFDKSIDIALATRLYYLNETQTWNFGQNTFNYTPPSGFNPGWYSINEDPYWESVYLYLKADYNDLQDSSNYKHPVYNWNNGVILEADSEASSGYAFRFNGGTNGLYLDEAITSAEVADIFLNNFTVEMWVKPSGTSPRHLFSFGGNVGIAYPSLNIAIDTDGSVRIEATTQGGTYHGKTNSSPNLVLNDTWYHIATTGQRIGGNLWIRIYVNGVLAVSKDVGAASWFGTNKGLLIGNYYQYSVPNFEPLSGLLDEIRITKGVCRYTGTFTPPSRPLLTGYTTDPYYSSVKMLCDFTKSKDDVKSYSTSTLYGGASISAVNGLVLNGTTDYLQTTPTLESPSSNYAAVTYEGFFKIGTILNQTSYQVLFTLGSTDAPLRHAFFYSGTTILLDIYGVGQYSFTVPQLDDNVERHIAFCRTPTTAVWNVYVNGIKAPETTTGLPSYIPNTITIGDFAFDGSPHYSLNGSVRGFRYTMNHNRYNSDFIPPTTPFLEG